MDTTTQVIELMDSDPDAEYLLRIRDLATGKETFLNKDYLLRKWTDANNGIQTQLFMVDKTEKIKALYKNKKR
ncbi:MAG: hypothetical protein H7282_04925 [Cytophagaceae bacterium]|nr:hypothetical protein [Cytophagaceae bacterium]